MSAFTLRPVAATDTPFLRALFRSVREATFRAMGWSDAQLAEICDLQFDAQAAGYRATYPGAEYLVIEAEGGIAAGRLTRARTPEAMVLVDIALAPSHRHRGIGSAVIRALQADAASLGLPLALTVESRSPARALYERLGFGVVSEHDLRCRMRWQRTPTNEGRLHGSVPRRSEDVRR